MHATVVYALYVLVLCVASHDHTHYTPPDKVDWIDPTDMIHDVEQQQRDKALKRKHSVVDADLPPHERCVTHDALQQCKDKLQACEKQVQKFAAPETPYFRQYVKFLQSYFNDFSKQIELESEVTVCVEMLLTRQYLDELAQFTKGGPVQDAHSVLVEAFQSVRPAQTQPSWVGMRVEWTTQHVNVICQIVCTVALVSLALSMQIRYRVPWVSLFYKLMIVIFILSIPWNWWHLYKLESAKRYADMLQEVPPDCKPKHQQSLWEAFSNAMSLDVDACTKYHQRMMTDPIWEIPPTKALAVTFTKFAVEPVEHVGHALNLFIHKALNGLPVYLWPVAIFFAVLMLVLIMVMTFGYRLNLFYMFGIEPGQPRSGVREHQLQLENRDLQDDNLAMKHENNKLKRNLQESQRALEETQLALDVAQPLPAIRAPPPYPQQQPMLPMPQIPAENLGPRQRGGRSQYDECDSGNVCANGAQTPESLNTCMSDTGGATHNMAPVVDGSGDKKQTALPLNGNRSPRKKTTLDELGSCNGVGSDTKQSEQEHNSAYLSYLMQMAQPKPIVTETVAECEKAESQCKKSTESLRVEQLGDSPQFTAIDRNDSHTPLDLTVSGVKSTDRSENGPETIQALEYQSIVNSAIPSGSNAHSMHCPAASPDTIPVSLKVTQASPGSTHSSDIQQSNPQNPSTEDVQTISPDLYSADQDRPSASFPIQEHGSVEHRHTHV